MERWLAHELCYHRDPTLVRFYPLNGPRGFCDHSTRGHHLSVVTSDFTNSRALPEDDASIGSGWVKYPIGGLPGGAFQNVQKLVPEGCPGTSYLMKTFSFSEGSRLAFHIPGPDHIPNSATFKIYAEARYGSGTSTVIQQVTVYNNGNIVFQTGTSPDLPNSAGEVEIPMSPLLSGDADPGKWYVYIDFFNQNPLNTCAVYVWGIETSFSTEDSGLSWNIPYVSGGGKTGANAVLTDAYGTKNLRFQDPKQTKAQLSEVAFDFNKDFTILSWVFDDNKGPSGPICGVQGGNSQSPTYGVITRGWTFGHQLGMPYLEMYSEKGPGANSSQSNWGQFAGYSYITNRGDESIGGWRQVGVVFRGSQVQKFWSVITGGYGYIDNGQVPPFISFFRNGEQVKIIRNGGYDGIAYADIRNTSSCVAGDPGDSFMSGAAFTMKPTFSVGCEVNPYNWLSFPYDFLPGAVCLLRIYNRALSNREIKEIYDREKNLAFFHPFDSWAADEAKGLTLFLNAYGGQTNSMTLFADATPKVPLFTKGFDSKSDSIPLSATGLGASVGSLSLYTFNSIPISDPIPLFSKGKDVVAGGVSLMTYGVTRATRGLPLFAKAADIPAVGNSLLLSLTGSNQNGFSRPLPLYAYAGPDAKRPAKGLPLFLLGPTEDVAAKGMNLVAKGEAPKIGRGIDLTAWNSQLGKTLGMPLYVKGDGVTDGAIPIGRGLFLVLKRDPANAITLYAQGPGEQLGSSVPLYACGVVVKQNSLNLSAPKVVGVVASPSAPLFASGF